MIAPFRPLLKDTISSYISKILLFVSWTNFKSKKHFIHKKHLGMIAVIFIFTAWALPGSFLIYPVFVILTYIFICQLDRPKFHLHLKYSEVLSLLDVFQDDNNESISKMERDLEHYLEKYE